MRMRRKSNLDERLSRCGDLVTAADLENKDIRITSTWRDLVDFSAMFPAGNPISLEIGCGKGGYICAAAAAHPEKNFVACEKISNVLGVAAERAKREGLKNVHFFNCTAEVLPRYIPEGSVSEIILNFSDPLPKDGYSKQRLTHPKFLEEYKLLLKSGGAIVQKTDSEFFFRYSLESYSACGFEIVSSEAGWDSEKCGDIETEYEKKFKRDGNEIYRIVAKKP